MEPFIADFINNIKVPKIIRCITSSLICAFVIAIGILCFLKSPMLIGRIFGISLSVIFLFLMFYLILKIYKLKKP